MERIEIHARVERDTTGLGTYVLDGQRIEDLLSEHYGKWIKLTLEQLPEPPPVMATYPGSDSTMGGE